MDGDDQDHDASTSIQQMLSQHNEDDGENYYGGYDEGDY